MLSVKQAEELKRQVSVLEETLVLKSKLLGQNQICPVSRTRSEKIMIGKEIKLVQEEINQIKEQLQQQAPPSPWEPEQVWMSISSIFQYRQQFEKDKAEFIEKINNSVSYGLEWYASSIVKSEKAYYLTDWVERLEEIENLVERIEMFYARLPKFIESLTGEVLQGARKQTSKSTSQSSNLVEAANLEATAELLEKLTSWSNGLNKIQGHFNSGKELQND